MTNGDQDGEQTSDSDVDDVEVKPYETPPSSPKNLGKKESVLQISMHVVQGKTFACNTFTLLLKIGGVKATVLVDSGSSATFISSQLAQKVECRIANQYHVKVMIVDGGMLTSSSICSDCHYEVQGEKFVSDMRILPLKGYDIILGADWICAQPCQFGFED